MTAKAAYARETRRLVLAALEDQPGPVTFPALAELIPSRTGREVRTALNLLCRDGGSVCSIGSTRDRSSLTFDLWVRVGARMRENAADRDRVPTKARAGTRGVVIA